jgi:hypothetical protein
VAKPHLHAAHPAREVRLKLSARADRKRRDRVGHVAIDAWVLEVEHRVYAERRREVGEELSTDHAPPQVSGLCAEVPARAAIEADVAAVEPKFEPADPDTSQ